MCLLIKYHGLSMWIINNIITKFYKKRSLNKYMKIICATSNKDKLREIREIFSDFDCEIVSMKEAGVSIDVEETGDTFLENAYIKAKAVWDYEIGRASCRERV